MELLDKPVYRVDGVEIDASCGTVKRAGQEYYLRQQTLQVLLYLLEHRDRIVNKEELIDNIWEGAAVTDNALVQCIADIRKALGDDSRQQRFLKTLPKLGYRFIGPVESHWSSRQVTIETEEITSVEIEFNNNAGISEPCYEAAAPERLLPPAHDGNSGFVLRRRFILASGIGLALLLGVAALIYPGKALLRTGRQPIEVNLQQVEGKKSVAVMYFENLSASRDLDWLREGLADMLITDLSRSNKLSVLGRQQLLCCSKDKGATKAMRFNSMMRSQSPNQPMPKTLCSAASSASAIPSASARSFTTRIATGLLHLRA